MKWAEGELQEGLRLIVGARLRRSAWRRDRGERREVAGAAARRSPSSLSALRRALLENERCLAVVLLAPTVILLGLFIAYPFVDGDLAVGDQHHASACRATSSGFENFVKAWNDTIFQTAVLEHVLLHVLARRSSSWRSGCGWRCCSTATSGSRRSSAPSSCCPSSSRPCSRPSPGSGCSTRPSASSTGCSTSSAASPTAIHWLGDGDLAMWCSIIIVNIWRGMPFFAITLLAGLQTISPDLHEAAAHRRRQRLAALLARHLAAAAAGDAWSSCCSR